ncbi:MAG: TetR/AcrR family transcriptional regulator [Candidatus Leucobacter sulfamidivorax]|nr:TetR/AcrR family transcriptional regulator [Candidatus Leucobacter sulfamidivorax]
MPRTPSSASDERRQRLLTEGMEAFGTTPYDEVVVSELARRAGVAAGLPFHYFGSKRGYFLAVLGRVAVEMREVLVPPEGLAPRDAVREMMRAHIRWLGGHSQQLRELVRGGLGGDAELRAAFEAARWEGASQLLATVGIDHLDENARIFVAGWIAMKDEIVMSWFDRDEQDRLDEERVIELLVQVLADTLLRLDGADPAVRSAVEAIR